MKKLSFYLFSVLAVLFSFTACGGETTDPDKPEDPDKPGTTGTYNVLPVEGVYFGAAQLGEGTASYVYTFAEKGITVNSEGAVEGTGALFSVFLVTEGSLDLNPAAGTYAITDVQAIQSFPVAIAGLQGQSGGPIGCYVNLYKDGKSTDVFYLTGGSVKVSGSGAGFTIALDATDADEVAYKFSYTGAIEMYNFPYGDESAKTSFTATATQVVARYYVGQDFVQYAYELTLDNGYMAMIPFFTAAGDAYDNFAQIAGTYNVALNYSIGDIPASVGYDGQYVNAPFVGKDSGQGLTEVYFITAGSMTIAADGAANASFTSFGGSKFNLTVNAGYTITQAQQAAPAARALNIAKEQVAFRPVSFIR